MYSVEYSMLIGSQMLDFGNSVFGPEVVQGRVKFTSFGFSALMAKNVYK